MWLQGSIKKSPNYICSSFARSYIFIYCGLYDYYCIYYTQFIGKVIFPGNFCENQNEIWVGCGKGRSCERVCGKKSLKCYSKATCRAGCRCRKGFHRDEETGYCVKYSDCTPEGKECDTLAGCNVNDNCRSQSNCECPPNSVWNNCGTMCSDPCNTCYIIDCAPTCQERCYCTGNYANINGTCMSRDLCPTCCGENEEYMYGRSSCQDKCNVDDNCEDLRNGCFCLPGFKRYDDRSPCIPEKECETGNF